MDVTHFAISDALNAGTLQSRLLLVCHVLVRHFYDLDAAVFGRPDPEERELFQAPCSEPPCGGGRRDRFDAAARPGGVRIAQWASQSSAAAALQQSAARFASGEGALVSLARENQDLGATMQGLPTTASSISQRTGWLQAT